ncbi:Copper amine oxidase 1 [Venturia nashicola]|uniref:Copper amine oxidase 1 n=1 Tax=Venturia nashicola TaxID=86259 RepID=A0A4Z1PBJ0_9PEZI|nr:Copper amine oxidase 1 [Venturia nashicola]
MTTWSGKIPVDLHGEIIQFDAYNLIINSPQTPTIPAPSLDSSDLDSPNKPPNKYNPSYQMLSLQPYLQARTLAFNADGTLSTQELLRFTMLPNEGISAAKNCLDIYAQYIAWYNISTQPAPDQIEDIRRLFGIERTRVLLELHASMVYGKKYFGIKVSGRDWWVVAHDGSTNKP